MNVSVKVERAAMAQSCLFVHASRACFASRVIGGLSLDIAELGRRQRRRTFSADDGVLCVLEMAVQCVLRGALQVG